MHLLKKNFKGRGVVQIGPEHDKCQLKPERNYAKK